MKTIINISNVTDTSGETPIVTYSNAVTTIVRQNPISQIYIHPPKCCCHYPFGVCQSCCNCGCQCGMQNMRCNCDCCPQRQCWTI